MELPKWFEYQLQSTRDGLIWAVRQLPVERMYIIPPALLGLGEWSAAQHVFHMLEYEEKLFLPSMQQWLGAPPAVDTRIEQGLPSVEEMLAQFDHVRREEINLLPHFSPGTWDSKQKTTFWGEVNLSWLICKTYQHTLEHTHDILSLVLFWDRRIARMAR